MRESSQQLRSLAVRLVALLALGGGATLTAQQDDDLYAEDLALAARSLEKGDLGRAAALWDDVLLDHEDMEGEPGGPSPETVLVCRIGLLEIALRGGAYEKVLEQIAALEPESARQDRRVEGLHLAALRRLGRQPEAIALTRRLLERDPSDLPARQALGELLAETGERKAAEAEFEAVIAASRRERVADPVALTAVAAAHAALGGLRDVERASVLLVEAIDAAPDLAAPRVAYGKLLFDVYAEWSGAPSGEAALKEVLERNGEVEEALVALYRIRSANMNLDPSKTVDYLDRALRVNPRSVPAIMERGVRLVDDRRFAEGASELDRALAINARDKRLLAERAAVARLMGDDQLAEDLRVNLAEVDPGSGLADRIFGDRLAELYRFADAVPHYERALEREPEDVEALEGLARCLVYAGQGERGKELLRRAKELQPGYVDPWRNNVIAAQELLEEEYETVESDGFVFFLHRDDAEVLSRYLVPYHDEARAKLGEKYGLVPPGRTRVEVFHTWDDFSVRTIGFRGFTALGACFGGLITLVSPVDVDLRKNDFMWSATVWHEYTHVLTLILSRARVPRWLTEGFSVYEERQKNRAWERGMARDLLDAWHNDAIPPVRAMNALFRGPRILFGYYLGGEIVTYLSEQHDFATLTEMLRAYGRDLSEEDVFRETFGQSRAEFDRVFREWLWKERLADLRIVPRLGEAAVDALEIKAIRDPDDLDAHVQLAWAYLLRGVEVDAANHVREVVIRDPDHPGVQLVRAELLRRKGNLAEARRFYERGFDSGADDFDSRIRYAALLEQLGDVDEAIVQYQAAKRCWPDCTEQDVAPELQLARVHGEAGRRDEAMMELRTYCRRTARAFQPRLQLAAYARETGDRRLEAELLQEAVEIDPFVRQVHVEYGRSCVALERLQDAAREFEMALAVLPDMDRQWIENPEQRPRLDSPEFLDEQAALRVELARVLLRLGRDDAAREQLERALVDAPNGDAADVARELLDR